MQAETQTKVKISVSEIKKILAEKFCLYHDFELEFVGDSLAEPDSMNKENNDWIDVPKDWNNDFCPTDFKDSERIDVIFRNGEQDDGVFPSEYNFAWRQENHASDVVKYRVSKQSN